MARTSEPVDVWPLLSVRLARSERSGETGEHLVHLSQTGRITLYFVLFCQDLLDISRVSGTYWAERCRRERGWSSLAEGRDIYSLPPTFLRSPPSQTGPIPFRAFNIQPTPTGLIIISSTRQFAL